MKIATVKVNTPKVMRHMNAGIAKDFDNYYRTQENEQIDVIVASLIHETQNMNYVNGVTHIYSFIYSSDNNESIKERIFRKYCQVKIKAE